MLYVPRNSCSISRKRGRCLTLFNWKVSELIKNGRGVFCHFFLVLITTTVLGSFLYCDKERYVSLFMVGRRMGHARLCTFKLCTATHMFKGCNLQSCRRKSNIASAQKYWDPSLWIWHVWYDLGWCNPFLNLKLNPLWYAIESFNNTIWGIAKPQMQTRLKT